MLSVIRTQIYEKHCETANTPDNICANNFHGRACGAWAAGDIWLECCIAGVFRAGGGTVACGVLAVYGGDGRFVSGAGGRR